MLTLNKSLKMIFIAWIRHNRRSQLLAQKFQMKLFLIQALKRWYFLAPVRYVLQTVTTVATLLREKPDVVFVQNPPIFAAMGVYLYAKLWRTEFVIDSHTGALLAPWWQWTLPLHAFLSRRAITTLVTNRHLAGLVRTWQAPAFIIADIPTEFPPGQPVALKDGFKVVVINTFSPDEPVAEILAAAALLPEVNFYITGDPIRANKSFLQLHPPNVTFTGFIPDNEYFGLLRSVDAIMVLTKDNYTMQRGACEAVSLGKPIITSDWPVLREYFHQGTLFVDNSCHGIRDGILQMQQEKDRLAQEITGLQQEHWVEWDGKYRELANLIHDRVNQNEHLRRRVENRLVVRDKIPS
jgi:glycosyltransferase involved in cell wall biosynthesis